MYNYIVYAIVKTLTILSHLYTSYSIITQVGIEEEYRHLKE